MVRQMIVKVKYKKNVRYSFSWKKIMNRPTNFIFSSTVLESVDVIKDLGVVFDSELSFVSHCKEKINPCWVLLREILYI